MDYKFSEVTDLTLKIDFSAGHDIGEFTEGEVKRELFVLYSGPKMAENKELFFETLQKWLKEKS